MPETVINVGYYRGNAVPDPLYPYTVIYAALITGAVPAGDYSACIYTDISTRPRKPIRYKRHAAFHQTAALCDGSLILTSLSHRFAICASAFNLFHNNTFVTDCQMFFGI